MRGQLHAGQLRHHDFAPLREVHLLRQQRILNVNATTKYDIRTFDNNIQNPLKIISTTTARRTLFTGPAVSLWSDWRLKLLERSANNDPLNLNLQYEFLYDIAEKHPEAAVRRIDSNPNFAMDDRSALLYLHSLQRIGKWNQFNLATFQHRLTQPAGCNVNPMIMESLNEITKEKGFHSLSKSQIAATAMKAFGAVNVHAAVGGGGGTSASFLSMAGAGSRGNAPGTNSSNPLHLVAQGVNLSFKDQLKKFTFYTVGLFLAVTIVGSLLDERGVSRAFGMSSKHIQEAEGSDVRFSDVKGVEEAKAELEEIVMYLKDPSRFTRLGGKLSRGILLTGPPGTGKTLLAKAVAGEADVPFYFVAGSQFEEVYVGLGAKRVRELFEAAKKKSPAIIFIDEIDAMGGSRKLKDQSAMKQTLNELLVQLDGFDDNSGVIVIGATNFAQSLDKALLRPGRMDKHVVVSLPDIGGRKEILEMYCKKTKLSPDVNLDMLARGTVGFSGADLNNLINQAALKASVDGLSHITMPVLEYAKDKIIMGPERKTAVITADNARNTAFHEAGHAVVAVFTAGANPIHKATIMPRGNALGMVMMLPEGDQKSMSYKQLVAEMDVLMGGRIAEELIFGPDDTTTGAYSDIQQASKLARNMVTKFGMSEKVGMVFHDEGVGGKMQATIDAEVKSLIDKSYQRAKELLIRYKKHHQLLAETLLEYETLDGDEVRDVVLKGKKPSRPVVNTKGGAMGNFDAVSKKTTSTASIA